MPTYDLTYVLWLRDGYGTRDETRTARVRADDPRVAREAAHEHIREVIRACAEQRVVAMVRTESITLKPR